MGRHQSPRARKALDIHVRALWGEEMNLPETDLVAIDPGDRWTGVAFFKEESDGWYCQDAIEMGREEFEDGFAELILSGDSPKIVVYERWRLYGDKANEQKGSEFDATQIIGVIKYICRVRNQHVDRHLLAEEQGKLMSCELQGGQCADPNLRVAPVELVGQMADIKKPTRGILRYKKIKSVAKPIAKELYQGRDHIVDAELHGWHHVLNTLKGSASSE